MRLSPATYAVLFSGLYTPLMLLLFALILRGVTFAFRGKVDDPKWRGIWDICLVVGSFLPSLLLGVAFANLFKGLPIDGEGIFQGNLFTLLNPYGLVGGLLFVAIFAMHGSLWLTTKAEGELQAQGGAVAKKIWPAVLLLAVKFLLASLRVTNLYDNYIANPVLFLIPALAVLALLATRVFMAMASWWKAFMASAVTIVSTTLFGWWPLSEPHPIDHRPPVQHDRDQFLLEPPDLEDHAGSGPDLRPHRHCLPGVGALFVQG